MPSRRLLLTAAGSAFAAGTVGGVSASPVRHWDREYDVIVVGAGLAGACAAHEALALGARVAILDSGGAASGASHGTIIYMGGGTALQRACGVHDTPEDMEAYLLASTGPEPDAARIRRLVEGSVGDYDWISRLGTPFSADPSRSSLEYSGSERAHPWRELVRPVPRGHVPDVPGAQSKMIGGGAWIQARLLRAARAGGAELYPDAIGLRLVRTDDGEVQGVSARIGGTELLLRGRRALILATGGFARNTPMVSQHAPQYVRCVPTDLEWNDGWGIRAAQTIGAAVRRMGAAGSGWYFYYPETRRQGILVNSSGQRFVPEDSYSGRVGDAIVRQQDGRAWLVLDARAMAGGTSEFIPDRIAATADDVVTLESRLGIPAAALSRTVEVYNAHAAKGADPLFHKAGEHLRPLRHPPFTAVSACVGEARISFFTLGGLHTTPDAEVLDVEGATIPGLYAAGRVSAGVPCPYYYSSGLNLAECIRFGRIAGSEAARRT